MTITHPLLRQVTESLKRTNQLRGELAVKAAVLHEAALALLQGRRPPCRRLVAIEAHSGVAPFGGKIGAVLP
jgi:hypothetical protein